MAKKKQKTDDVIREEEMEEGCCSCGSCCCEDDDVGPEDDTEGFFKNCICGENTFPIVMVANECGTFVGEMITLEDSEMVALRNPLRFVEAISQTTRAPISGLIRPYANLGVPKDIVINPKMVMALRSDDERCLEFIRFYEKSLEQLRNEDVTANTGLVLPGTPSIGNA